MFHFDEKFWLAIAFFTFVTLIFKFVWPLISRALDNGSKKIAEEILAVKEMKEDAEKLLAQAERLYQDASSFAEKLTKDAETEVRNLVEESKRLLEDEVSKKRASALERVRLEEESAINDLKIKIVNSALEKLTVELNLNQEGHEKLIEKAITNLGKTVH